MLLLGALDDIMLKILMACAIIQMVTEKATHDDSDPNAAPWYVDGLAIWLAVAVVSLVTAISDYQKEGEFLKKQMIEENSKVVSQTFSDSYPVKIVHIHSSFLQNSAFKPQLYLNA